MFIFSNRSELSDPHAMLITMKNTFKNMVALLIGLIVSFLIAEVVVRYFYADKIRIRGEKLSLARNLRMVIDNHTIPGLDPVVLHSKNSLGFRGPPLPEHPDAYYKIITVGGSTTESTYISDGKTWPDLLTKKIETNFKNIWLNNAGLEGHSTFGHKILLEDSFFREIHPQMILFLIGINDMRRSDLVIGDQRTLKQHDTPWIELPLEMQVRTILFQIVDHSELSNFLLNLYRYLKAKRQGIIHHTIDVKQLPLQELPTQHYKEVLASNAELVTKYQERVLHLIHLSREMKSVPVFITQPSLLGCETDTDTGVNLAQVRVGQDNGCLRWQELELYNDALRKLSRQQSVYLIDLAKEFPHRSSYFYDFYHFNNAGSEAVANIISQRLHAILEKEIPL
ncbi:MAG: SGNH/GDSL hydrolase family protein [Magnetococcus sp. DMHC-6]